MEDPCGSVSTVGSVPRIGPGRPTGRSRDHSDGTRFANALMVKGPGGYTGRRGHTGGGAVPWAGQAAESVFVHRGEIRRAFGDPMQVRFGLISGEAPSRDLIRSTDETQDLPSQDNLECKEHRSTEEGLSPR